MTATPDVPLHVTFSIEVPGTPEQVWDAIATADGLSSWMLPTDLEEREGGALRFHMGEDMSSSGTVTGWERPNRFVYEEPDWPALGGREGAVVTPMRSEFLVEARAGGTCLVTVVTSAFGTGADWEQEFFDDMIRNWQPMFDHLRLYLASFAGQRATSLSVSADVAGDERAVWSALLRALDVRAAGQPTEIRGLRGQVEHVADQRLLLSVTDPVPGFLSLVAYPKGEGMSVVQVEGYLFSATAAGYVEREQQAWKSWLQDLAVPAS